MNGLGYGSDGGSDSSVTRADIKVLRVSLGTVRSPRTTVMSVQAAREKFYALVGATYGLNINGATMARRVMWLFAFGYNTEISYLRNHQYYPCLAFRILAI